MLPRSSPKWLDGDGEWDAVTPFGVRILKPEVGEWREVSEHGEERRDRPQILAVILTNMETFAKLFDKVEPEHASMRVETRAVFRRGRGGAQGLQAFFASCLRSYLSCPCSRRELMHTAARIRFVALHHVSHAARQFPVFFDKVTVAGAVRQPRVGHLHALGALMRNETNELTSGTVIDVGGVQVWEYLKGGGVFRSDGHCTHTYVRVRNQSTSASLSLSLSPSPSLSLSISLTLSLSLSLSLCICLSISLPIFLFI